MGILIRNGGFLTTVQDLGRAGYQRFGVPASGVMDRRSFTLANLLVGNEQGEAALEITMLGPQVEFEAGNVVALTGGDLTAQLNGKPMPIYRAVAVQKGDVLSFGAPKHGSRAYLAFAGGLALDPVMGSRSTYIKAGIGGLEGRKLGKGDRIGFRAPKITLEHLDRRGIEQEKFEDKERTLRVILGPQDDAFTQKGIETFLHGTYTVTNEFDRMGCRLEGEVVEHVKDGNIISDGISFGAVQIPSEGKPIIMLADRQTTGGYTKIAHVISVDLPLIAQCKAGDILHFEKVDVERAQELYLEEQARFARVGKDLGAGKGIKVPTPEPAPKASAKAPLDPLPEAAVQAVEQAVAVALPTHREFVIHVHGRSFRVVVDAV